MDGNFENNYQDNMANIPYQAPMNEAPVGPNGLQIAGLVCGILAIVSCWCYCIIGVLLSVAGLICSIIGNKKGKTGMGTAGLICSIIGLILGVISLINFVIVLGYVFSMVDSMNVEELETLLEMYTY